MNGFGDAFLQSLNMFWFMALYLVLYAITDYLAIFIESQILKICKAKEKVKNSTAFFALFGVTLAYRIPLIVGFKLAALNTVPMLFFVMVSNMFSNVLIILVLTYFIPRMFPKNFARANKKIEQLKARFINRIK